jgi:ribulose kinase
MRLLATMMGAVLTIAAAFGVAQASGRTADGRCWTQPGAANVGQTVEIWADGLPTKTALNVFVTDAHGTYGWPVGVQPAGTIEAVWYVPNEAGTSTIRITGPERPNNVKVYATCGMEVS